jgi:hypothetical protein
MKTKKFNYAKWGKELVDFVKAPKELLELTKLNFDFWEEVTEQIEERGIFDKVKRRPDQWRRIYYEAKKREKMEEKETYTPEQVLSITPKTISDEHRVIHIECTNDLEINEIISVEFWNYINELQQNQKDIENLSDQQLVDKAIAKFREDQRLFNKSER